MHSTSRAAASHDLQLCRSVSRKSSGRSTTKSVAAPRKAPTKKPNCLRMTCLIVCRIPRNSYCRKKRLFFCSVSAGRSGRFIGRAVIGSDARSAKISPSFARRAGRVPVCHIRSHRARVSLPLATYVLYYYGPDCMLYNVPVSVRRISGEFLFSEFPSDGSSGFAVLSMGLFQACRKHIDRFCERDSSNCIDLCNYEVLLWRL